MDDHDAILTARVGPAGDTAGCAAVMPWWSFTKTLIAAATLRLAEAERVALDEPCLALDASPRALMLHHAGLPDYGRLRAYHDAVARGDEPWPEDAMLAALPPATSPGRFSYSNVGYMHLRRLIVRTTDLPFATALRDLVLAPLDLTARVAVTRADMAPCAVAADRTYNPGWVYHGLVVGPVAEAAGALHHIVAGNFLTPASRMAMGTAHKLTVPDDGRPWIAAGYGLGLMIGTMRAAERDIAVAGHTGGGPGSTCAIYHACRQTVAVFAPGPTVGPTEHVAAGLLANA